MLEHWRLNIVLFILQIFEFKEQAEGAHLAVFKEGASNNSLLDIL